MRKHGKIDANQAMIVRELRRLGYSVLSLAAIGGGCPDIVVGKNGVTVLLEIKDGTLPQSKRRLTPDESKFFSNWRGAARVVETTTEAIAALAQHGAV